MATLASPEAEAKDSARNHSIMQATHENQTGAHPTQVWQALRRVAECFTR